MSKLFLNSIDVSVFNNFYFVACADPKEIEKGRWAPSSSVELWDEYIGSITVVQQVQYSCDPRYKIEEGSVSYVNCDHNTNSFTPDPPSCVYIGDTNVFELEILFS